MYFKCVQIPSLISDKLYELKKNPSPFAPTIYVPAGTAYKIMYLPHFSKIGFLI